MNLEKMEFISQREGLHAVGAFVAGKTDFTTLRPFILSGEPRRLIDGNGFLFDNYLGAYTGRDRYLRFQIDASQIDQPFIGLYVTPRAELTRGERPYYWLEIFKPQSDKSEFEKMVACRLKPEDPVYKVDFSHWHNLEEQLIVDYLLNENRIDFEDLLPFVLNVRNKLALKGYRLGGHKGMEIQIDENPQVMEGHKLKFIPKQDGQGLYQWLDILRPTDDLVESKWPVISSYRLLRDQRSLASVGWLGPEKQALADYIRGESGINFQNLRPFRAVLSRSYSLDIIQLRRSANLTIAVNFPPDSLSAGDEIVIVPKEDDKGKYQWLEVYKFNSVTGEPIGENIVSARLTHDGINQRNWHGPEIELLKDFTAGKIDFGELRPIHLEVTKSGIINLWKEGAKKIYLVASRRFGLQLGEQVHLTPVKDSQDNLSFLLVKGEITLGKYRFDFMKKAFYLEEIIYQANEGWFDDKTGIYADRDGQTWITAYRLMDFFRSSHDTIKQCLQGVTTRTYQFKGNAIFYNQTEARSKLLESGILPRTDLPITSEEANEQLERLIEG